MDSPPYRLMLMGDVMLGRGVDLLLKEESPHYPWGNTLGLLTSADWRACNLECVFTHRHTPWTETPKAFHFRSHPKNVAVLTAAKIDAVSLANNHVLDYQTKALDDTLKVLDQHAIAHSGAGRDRRAAMKPARSKVANLNLALLAFTDNEPSWAATPSRPGVFFVPCHIPTPQTHELLEEVRQLKKTADLVVVSTHWGSNWGYPPPSSHITLAHSLIDAGADIVYGHSPHVFRGIQIYRGCPILYSTGNFIDDYYVDPVERNDQSFIFEIRGKGTSLQRITLHPTIIREGQARLADEEESQNITAKMAALCAKLGTLTHWNPTNRLLEIEIDPSKSTPHRPTEVQPEPVGSDPLTV